VSHRWLERSGQEWKIRYSNAALYAGYACFAFAFVGPRVEAAIAGVLAPVFLLASVVLPLLIRCRVCGLRLETSATARSLSYADRSSWVERLEACPVCEDDGRGTPESRTQWLNSGKPPERAYWSVARLLVAVLLAVILLAASFFVVNRRSKQIHQGPTPSHRSWNMEQAPDGANAGWGTGTCR
jgi:hypothetical protein